MADVNCGLMEWVRAFRVAAASSPVDSNLGVVMSEDCSHCESTMDDDNRIDCRGLVPFK